MQIADKSKGRKQDFSDVRFRIQEGICENCE